MQEHTETEHRGNPLGGKPKTGRPTNLEKMPLDTVADARQFLVRMVQLATKGEI